MGVDEGVKCAALCCRVQLFATLWTVASQAPLSMGILQARILESVAMPSYRGSSQPRDRSHISCVSCTAGDSLLLSHQGSQRTCVYTYVYSVLFLVTQSCPTLCDPMDCSPPGSSVLGDSPGKNTGMGCHAMPFSRGSSQPKN